jgi:hypothetical protein
VALVFGGLVAVAEGAEVDSEIDVEPSSALGALNIENADGLTALLPPRCSRLLESALLECGSRRDKHNERRPRSNQTPHRTQTGRPTAAAACWTARLGIALLHEQGS